MSRLFQLRLVGAVLASLIVGMGTAAQGQHDLAAGLSPDGQLPHNPFRQAGFQQSEGYDSPTSLEGIDRQLDSAFKPVESIGVDITSSLAGERPEQKSLASREGMSETMVLVRPWPTLSY